MLSCFCHCLYSVPSKVKPKQGENDRKTSSKKEVPPIDILPAVAPAAHRQSFTPIIGTTLYTKALVDSFGITSYRDSKTYREHTKLTKKPEPPQFTNTYPPKIQLNDTKPLKILVIEDSFLIQKLLIASILGVTRPLMKQGIPVQITLIDRGDAMQKQYEEIPFDIIFSDYHLREVSGLKNERGFEITKHLKSLSPYRMHLCISASSENPNGIETDQGVFPYRGLFDAVFIKPVKIESYLDDYLYDYCKLLGDKAEERSITQRPTDRENGPEELYRIPDLRSSSPPPPEATGLHRI